MADVLVRGFAAQSSVRWLYLEAEDVVEETARRHGLLPSAARLAAELLAANALMSAWIKGEERLSLQVQSGEPRIAFRGEADAEGFVRAEMSPDRLPNDSGRLDGVLLAIKYDRQRELYRGTTLLSDETVESSLQRHLTASEQVDALVRIESHWDDEGAWGRTVGLVIERLPEEAGRPSMTREAFAAWVAGLRQQDLGGIGAGLSDGRLGGHDAEVLDERELVWRCRCSDDGVLRMLYQLGAPTLREMADEDHGAEVTCHFCNTVRRFDEATLRRLLAELAAAGVAEA